MMAWHAVSKQVTSPLLPTDEQNRLWPLKAEEGEFLPHMRTCVLKTPSSRKCTLHTYLCRNALQYKV